MNALPFLILHKTPRSDNGSTPGSGTPFNASLPERPDEPMSLSPVIGAAPAVPDGMLLPRAAKRSHETAFGMLPTPVHLYETPRQGSVMAGAEPTAKRIRTAAPDEVERLPLPDLIEGAMSRDDKTAISFIHKFLALPIEPGPDFAEFIEGWKILTSHAADRQPPLQGWEGRKIFYEGLSCIRRACIGRLNTDQSTIKSQIKMQLFASGTPSHFIKYAECLRKSKIEARNADATLSTAYNVITAFNLRIEIKAANRRLIRETEDLSCQQRVDAMRTRLAQQAAAVQGLVRPGTAGLTSANGGHTSFKGLIAMLEKSERIGFAQVNSALLEPIQTLEQIPSRIRMVQACCVHLSMAAHQVDGFDAIALIRLAGVRLEAQAARFRKMNGNDVAKKFRHAVKTQILDADTPHEYIVAAQAAHELVKQPREVDSKFNILVLKRGLNLVASAKDFEGFINRPDWMSKSGHKPYETLLAECSIAGIQRSDIRAQASDSTRTASTQFSPASSIARPTTMAPGTSTIATSVPIEPLLRSTMKMPAAPST